MNKILLVLCLIITTGLISQDAESIIKKVDANNTFESYKGSGKVIIEGKYGKRTSEYLAYAKGTDDSLIEFLSGEEEGQKIFKTADDLYIKYPYAEEIQRLSRKKTLGAVSYDEMSGERDTLKNYDVKLLREDEVDGNPVYVIELIAKTSKVAHYKQEIFVDKNSYAVWKVLYYSKSNKLTKEMLTIEMEKVGNKTVAVHSLITDKLKKNNSTENIITDIQIDIDLSDSLFSLDELSW
ncbi:MAG: outer membrane lipoprotein-sorting protein [Spirochaetales bacterium]|nr:outer membrane lipoprotein-sorting protein [Spirochaetales bacterium]